jgi:hypothetical protein
VGGPVVEALRRRGLPFRAPVLRDDERVDTLRATGADVVAPRPALAAGDAAGAVADARRAVALLEGLPARDARQWFSLACARATLAATAGRGGAGPSTALASGLADRAIDDLRRAAAMGYRSPAAYRYEPALGSLRGRDDFHLLLLDLAFPADPFAR